MTDPRTALAEAEHDYNMSDEAYCGHDQHPFWCETRAATILAALDGWMLISKPMLLRALVDVEEDKIDPRWFADEMPDDYEPPGLGCEDAVAIWDALAKPNLMDNPRFTPKEAI